MKLLTQEIFKNQPEKFKSASLDSEGNVWILTDTMEYFYITEENQLSWNFPVLGEYIESGYDTTNWKTSKINRI